MPDEVIAWLQQLGNRLRLRFEVASVDRWVRRIARAIRNHQRVAVGQRPEGIPGRTVVADASMHEDDPRPAADRLDVKVGHKRKINRLHRQSRRSLQNGIASNASAAAPAKPAQPPSGIASNASAAAPAKPTQPPSGIASNASGVNKVGRKWA